MTRPTCASGSRSPASRMDFSVAPVDELHDDVGELRGLAVIEDADDVGVGEPARGLGLALEAGEFLLGVDVGGVGQADGLDGDLARDDRVPALVDGPHRTLAEGAADLVFAELVGGHVVIGCR